MNIAIFIPTLQAGGAEKQAVILARSLYVSHRVIFIVFYGNLPQDNKNVNALNEYHIPIIALKGSFFQKLIKLYRILKENRTEVAFNYLTLCDFVGSMIEHLARVGLIFNGIRSSRLSFGKELAEKLSLRLWANAAICNSHCAVDYFGERGFKKSRLIVIPNCFEKISPFFHRNPNELANIITVGRFDPAKDYETTIKTVARAREKYSNIHFTIVGHGLLEEKIRSWVSQYDLTDITDILINPDNIHELLDKSDVFLNTSLYEGTSNAIMEALNSGLPIVCTNVGDNPHMVINGLNGYTCDVGDVEALSESLVRLVSNYDLRISFGKESNKILCANYSSESFNEHISSILKTD